MSTYTLQICKALNLGLTKYRKKVPNTFVKVTIGQKLYKTPVIKSSQNPVWDYSLCILDDSTDDSTSLIFQVVSKYCKKGQVMGMVTISFADLKKKISEIQPVSFNLKNKSNESLPGSFLLISIMQQWDVASSAINKTKEGIKKLSTKEESAKIVKAGASIVEAGNDSKDIASTLSSVTSVAFSPDGQKILSGSEATAYHAQARLRELLREDHDDSALGHRDQDNEQYIMELRRLGSILFTCFEESAQTDYINGAVNALFCVIRLTPEDHPEKAQRLNELAFALHARFERLGNLDDLENDIIMSRHALELTPDDHPSKVQYLSNLATSLHVRFERLGGLKDLEDDIGMSQHALDLTADDDSEKLDLLGNLATSLHARFERLGNLDDLEKDIAMSQYALDLTSDNDPEKPARLSNLSLSLHARFGRLGHLADIDSAILRGQGAVELTSDGEPIKARYLSNLAVFQLARFGRVGDLVDIESAISNGQRAVNLTPDDEPIKGRWLSNLTVSLLTRFGRLGDLADIENAISSGQRAVDVTPDDEPIKPRYLSGLALSLHYRFDRLGDLGDIESAISSAQHAVDLTPDDEPLKGRWLSNLAVFLLTRYKRLDNLDDIEGTILNGQRAVDLTPNDAPMKARYLSNLALSLQNRFERLDHLTDIERAISSSRHAVDLTADDDPMAGRWLNNLAVSLHARFKKLDNLADLEDAIYTGRRAVDLTPEDEPINVRYMNGVALSLHSRFERLGDMADLEHAISFGQRAVSIIPDDDPSKARLLISLATSLSRRFEQMGNHEDFQNLMKCLTTASTALTVGTPKPSIRLEAAKHAIRVLSKHSELCTPEELLEAHSRVVLVLPELTWLGHSVTRRFEESVELGSLVTHAVAYAISIAALIQAADWLEDGRSLIWTQILSLRSPLDELARVHPDLASKLGNVRSQLERSAHHLSVQMPILNEEASDAIPTSAANKPVSALDQHRRMVIFYEGLLKEIHSKDGFSDFLVLKKHSALISATVRLGGPVVYLNVHSTRCDALIATTAGKIESVHLSHLTETRANKLRELWQGFLQSNGVRERATQSGISWRKGAGTACRILQLIWIWVVYPVLDRLNLICDNSSARDNCLPHIFWCPTGPLTQLPLHAAGIYNNLHGPALHVYDYVVSSYTPSLSALLRCTEGTNQNQSTKKVLVVMQPATPGLSPLQGTKEERERLCMVLPENACTILNHENATVDAALGELPTHPWLHLACHGLQSQEDPTKSAFALYDGPLSLATLMNTTSKDAELAFLSACQTAAGDRNSPEEAAHLAAGMLAVGFKGVVATMWSIKDADAPIVVEAYYRKLLKLRASGLLREGETGAAYAIHEAVKILREQVGEQKVDHWAPFVHFGA